VNEFESRLVWIFGSPRTGSTWLLRLICHPLVLDAEDPLGFRAPSGSSAPADALPVDEMFFANHLAPWNGGVTHEGTAYRPNTLNAWRGGRGGYVFARQYEDVWRPAMRELALVRLHAMVERASELFAVPADASVVVKEVVGSHAADTTMSLFPRSRLLFLVRDGRDVVDSQLQGNLPGGWTGREIGTSLDTPEEQLEFVRRQSSAWMCATQAVQTAFDAHDPERRMLVRYEDLRASTESVLALVVEWMGLRRAPRRIERAVQANAFERVPGHLKGPSETYRAATPGLWRESLTPEQAAVAQETMGEKLAELGYEI
jgi:hypothetical protein